MCELHSCCFSQSLHHKALSCATGPPPLLQVMASMTCSLSWGVVQRQRWSRGFLRNEQGTPLVRSLVDQVLLVIDMQSQC
mmetsp:Transcript_38675/g.90895  ORF Transcript_38675/g.90895 Transcript_38675/m.90895 type:complete len:80 (-) Transcript_38675:10-249(-)